VNEQNRKLPYTEEVVAAWREQLAEAAENPWLAELLLKYGERILRRFTYFYEQLRTLSRRARRYIQRKLALSLSAAAFLLALSGMHVPVAYAAGIDVDDGVVAVADDNQCSLVEAILNANNDGQLYTSLGECAAGNGADIINLPPGGLFNLTGAYASSDNGLPIISSKITIEGNGSTIQGDGSSRIFAVDLDGDLAHRDTTVTGGYIKTGTSPSYYGDGGGILNYGKVAILNNSVISSNYAYDDGGGVFNDGGEVTIENSLVAENEAHDGSGGGVYNYDGALTINNSVISGNEANDDGGGVFNDYGVATIEKSTISSNFAFFGGGVANVDGSKLNIKGSTISGNAAVFIGGGMYNYWSELTIENSAVSGNTADFIGGGVDNWAGYVTIDDSDILDNAAYLGGGVCNNCAFTIIKDKVAVQNSELSGAIESRRGSAVQQPPFWYWGEVAIENSAVSGNTAIAGGGVANMYGLVTIENSAVSNNDAYYYGGVLNHSHYGPDLTEKSTVSGNAASSLDSVHHYYYGAVTVIENSTISGNDARSGSGGGVANYLYVNSSGTRSAPGEDASSHDGVVNVYRNAVIIRDSTVSGNQARGDGGGVFNYVHYHYTEQTPRSAPQASSYDVNFYYGAVVIENSTISGNEAGEEIDEGIPFLIGGRGGGVFNGYHYSHSTTSPQTASPLAPQQWYDWCKVAIKESTISDNDALYGGGVFNGYRRSPRLGVSGLDAAPLQLGDVYSSLVTIENSTISGNKAQAKTIVDEGVYSYGGAGGGVFNVYGGVAVIDHSAISGNEADGSEFRGEHDDFIGVGGGVFNAYGVVDILNDSTISGNVATGGYCHGNESHDTHVINGGGGGLFNYYGLVFVTDSAISGNIVSGGYNENDYTYDLFVLTGGGGVLNAMRYSGGERSAVSGNALSPLGVQNGGLHYWGEVVIENSDISGNVVSEGGYDYEDDYIYMMTAGGGVLNFTSREALARSAISGEDASPLDSAQILPGDYAYASINQSTISGNIVAGAWYDGGASYHNGGGGVANSGGEIRITDSTISDNTAGYGGGVGNEYGEVDITQSTISGNDAFFGGGVGNFDGGVSLYHSTISDNTANRYGGGVANESGGAGLGHTIVSGNTAVRGREVAGDADTYYYNLFGHDGDPGTYVFVPNPSLDIVPGIDIRVRDILDPLADNGGPTETHALVHGSKAIDTGDPNLSKPIYDQRGAGFERVVNEVMDIGAYEYQPPAPVGGFTSPANGLEQLLPTSGLLAAIVALATSGIALVKRRRE